MPLMGRRSLLKGIGLAIAAPAIPALAQSPDRLRMAFNSHYAPLCYLDASGKASGLMVEALTMVGDMVNVAFDYVDRPWGRGQQMVRSGDLDAFCTPSTPDRRDYAMFTQNPLFTDPGMLLGRANDDRLVAGMSVNDLRRLKLGSQVGVDWPHALPADVEIEWVRDIGSLVAMVAAGRLDATVLTGSVAKAALADSPSAAQLKVVPCTAVLAGQFRIGLRASYPDAYNIVTRLDYAVQEIQRSGAMQTLVSRYL